MGSPCGAISLSGGQYISTAHHARLDFALESFAVNIRYKGTAAGHIVNKFDNTNSLGWKIESLADGTVRATVNGTAITGGSSVLNGSFHDIELAVDRSRARLLLFVDGLAVTAVDMPSNTTANSSAVQVGRNPDGLSTLTGSIAEFRISSGVRHQSAYTPAYTQFADDGLTRLLWHFNEGKGSTIFDLSAGATDMFDAGTRHNGIITGGPGTWAYGPLLANPARIIHEAIWYGIDTDTAFTAYGEAARIRRHRARKTDESTNRILTSGLTIPDIPGIWCQPLRVSGVPPETNAYNEATIPVIIAGGIYNGDVFSATDLWWILLRAINKLEVTDAGAFLHTRVQNWRVKPLNVFNTVDEAGGLISRFLWEMDFFMRVDIRTDGTL